MIQVEYREAPTAGFEAPLWRSAGTMEIGAELELPNLIAGTSYEVRAREVREDGSYAAWTYSEPVEAALASREAAGAEEAPASPQNVRIDRDGCLAWDYPAAASLPPGVTLAGFEVRTAPDTYDVHDAMQPVHDGLVAPGAPVSLCGVPRGTRTMSVVAVLSSGQKSDPAQAVIYRGPFDEGADVVIEGPHNEHTGFSGTKTNCSVSAGVLTQSTQTRIYGPRTAHAYGASATTVYSARYPDATYVFRATVAAAPTSEDGQLLTLDATCTGLNWRIEYRTHVTSSVAYGSSGDPAYGEKWEPAYGDLTWRRWPGSLPVRAADDYDFRLTMPGGAKAAGTCTALSWRVTRPSSPAAMSHALISETITITNVGPALAEVPGAYRTKTDLSAAKSIRCVCRVSTAAATGTPDLYLQYSTDESTWATLTSNKVNLETTGTQATSWEAPPAGALADVYVRAVTKDGNATDDPVITNVFLQVR